MYRLAKRIVSMLLIAMMIITVIPMYSMPASAASKTLTLYQYTGTGSSKVAGRLYVNSQNQSAKVIFTETGKVGNLSYGTIKFENVKSFQGLGNCSYSDQYNSSTLYYKMKNDWIAIFGNDDNVGGDDRLGGYFILGKVHGGPSLSTITKIDTFKCKTTTSGVKIGSKRFKDFSQVSKIPGSAYFKKAKDEDNPQMVYQSSTGGTNTAKITKPSKGKSTSDNCLRTGPGYNYPVVTGFNLASVGSEVFDVETFSTLAVDDVTFNTASVAQSIVIKSGETLNITQVQNGWGQTTYKGYTGWVNLNYYQRIGALIVKPNPPVVRLDTAPDIPATGMITVSWDKVEHAKYYKAVLYNSVGAEVKSYGDLYGTTATFSPADEGVYTVKVYAQNSMYTSDAGVLAQAITVHGKSKVTYLDHNGNVIGTQDVSYNNSSTAPLAPEREGYTFYGWSDAVNSIKGDKTVTAQYTINEYPVKFFDKEGNQIGQTQYVKYKESAVPPSEDEIPAVDKYSFVGWSSEDYKNVYRENKYETIEIHPVYIYNNTEIPVTCTITEASRQKDGYYVIFDIENHIKENVQGRAIIALKTSSDKLAYTTESAAFSIPGETTKRGMEVFVPCESAAATAEVIILDGFENNIPISEAVSSDIDLSDMWSEWKDYTTLPDFDNDTEYETRTVYSYSTKNTTTYHTDVKLGWTLFGARTPHPGNWSAWTDAVIDTFDYPEKTRKTKTQVVNTYATRTLYDYFHYYNYSTGRSSPVQYSGFSGPHYISPTWALQRTGSSNVSGWSHYGTHACGSCSSSNYWYPNGSHSEQYVSGQKTQYSYMDTTYTYYFYQWSDYSPWQTDPVLPTDSRQVKTKTQYRTKSVSAEIEDDSGELRTVNGMLNVSLVGKKINLYVVKYNANSDFTNEYVGQSTIKADGSYSFTFKLREEPSPETGDMVAFIGVQGTEKMQAVKVFEAPKATFTVKYYDDIDSADPISVQQVQEGSAAVIPSTNPYKEGYVFAGWNNTCTNVRSDMEVRPIFVEEQYVVKYVDARDESNNKTEFCTYGTPLTAELAGESPVESGTYVGWDLINDKEKVVTGNTLLFAEYETKTYDVIFEGVDGEIVDTVQVEHEGFVELPELPEKDGVEFLEWDVVEDDLTEVTDSMVVKAIYYFDETTAVPECSLASGAYQGTQTVTLTPETENDVIWYTLDGTDPSENPEAIEYTGPFTVSDTTVLNYYAGSFGKNDSELMTYNYVINGNGKLVTVKNGLYPDYEVTFIVDSLNDINKEDFAEDGHTLEGFYYDDGCTDKANLFLDSTGTVVTLYTKYTVNSYTVEFCDDGRVVETKTLPYGSEATPPEMYDKGDMKFVGWDSDAYLYFAENTQVNAIYKLESEIVTVDISKKNITIGEKSTFDLTATVNSLADPELDVIWISDNTDIATVNDMGTVTSVSKGTTTIFAVAEDDSAYAMCTVTVEASPNYSLCINPLSYLGLDSDGNLHGIKVGENTVAEIKKNFQNTDANLKFVNAKGTELTDTDLVGTGSVVYLMEDNKAIDELNIIMTGDVNFDGKVNLMDSSRVSRYLVGKETFDYNQQVSADVNGDGKLNLRDAAYICRYTVGKEEL